MSSQLVEFHPEKLQEFEKEYKIAEKEQKETFFFEGNEYVIGYAKYLIQYLKSRSR